MAGLRYFLTVVVCLISTSVLADTELRVATYNIKFLDAATLPGQADREQKLKSVLQKLDADVIALQEIDDRAALARIFPANQWQLVIDDDSGNSQDVALAVRSGLQLPDFVGSLDADDDDFLFPGSANEHFFPNRRDVLAVRVRAPGEDRTFVIMVMHAKARSGGRTTTEPRRVGSSVVLIQRIGADFDAMPVVVLGDFNDTPDDRSLNILESGDANAGPGPDQQSGPFLVNVTEALYDQGHVTFGRKSSDIANGLINTIDPDARVRNLLGLGNDDNTGDQMFDQILLSPEMAAFYVDGSAKVFDDEDAARGNDNSRASDHLPVFADFIITPGGPAPSVGALSISGLLPNPNGPDDGKETVTIFNPTAANVPLDGWRIVDRAGNVRSLDGQVAVANQQTTIVLAGPAMLNNSGGGDRIDLLDPTHSVVASATYAAEQALSGAQVTF